MTRVYVFLGYSNPEASEVALQLLSEREWTIFKRTRGIPAGPYRCSLSTLATEMGISKQRVSRILARAIRKVTCAVSLLGDHGASLDQDWEYLPFSVRAYNALKNSGVSKLSGLIDLVQSRRHLKLKQVGPITSREIENMVHDFLYVRDAGIYFDTALLRNRWLLR